jgi:hypothetical protein
MFYAFFAHAASNLNSSEGIYFCTETHCFVKLPAYQTIPTLA